MAIQRGRVSLRRLFVRQVLAMAFGMLIAVVASAVWLHTPLAFNVRVVLKFGAVPVVVTGVAIALMGRRRRRSAQRNQASH